MALVRWHSIKEVADALSVHYRTVRRYNENETIPPVYVKAINTSGKNRRVRIHENVLATDSPLFKKRHIKRPQI